MKEDLFQFFWILFEKCIRRCRAAPLSFHPWSWWDVRERLTLGRAQFISPSIFPSLQYSLLLPPSLQSYINRPSLQCNLPGIAQYQWESYEWKLVRGVSFLARGNYYLAADPRVFAGGSLQLSNQNILQSHFKRFIMFEILFWGWKRYRNNLLDVTDQ